MTDFLRFRAVALGYRVWFPLACVAFTVAIGLMMEQLQIVQSFYASPFVLAVTIAALSTGRGGGYLASVASVASFNFVFVKPAWVFTVPTPEEVVTYVTMFAAAYVAGRHRVQPETRTAERYRGSLPFVRDKARDDDKTERSWWDVLSSGDWSEDTVVGHEYGRLYIAKVIRTSTPPLSWVIRDMIKAGRYTGVEAGFCGALRNAIVGKDPLTNPLLAHYNAADAQANGSIVGADGQIGTGPVRDQD